MGFARALRQCLADIINVSLITFIIDHLTLWQRK